MAGLTGRLPRLTRNGGGSGLRHGDRAANGRRSTAPPSSDSTRKGGWPQQGSARCRRPSGTDAGKRHTRRPARCWCRRTSRQPCGHTRGLDGRSPSWIARIATRFSIGCMKPGELTLGSGGLPASFACSRPAKRSTHGSHAAAPSNRCMQPTGRIDPELRPDTDRRRAHRFPGDSHRVAGAAGTPILPVHERRRCRRAVPGDTTRKLYFGTTEVDLDAAEVHAGDFWRNLGAVSRASVDPVYPPILGLALRGVYQGQPRLDFTLSLGSIGNRRDGVIALDGWRRPQRAAGGQCGAVRILGSVRDCGDRARLLLRAPRASLEECSTWVAA